jgi:transcriptional regulator with XRE-family HTH domain
VRNPTLDTLLRIAAALEIDLAEIIDQAIRSAAKDKSK